MIEKLPQLRFSKVTIVTTMLSHLGVIYSCDDKQLPSPRAGIFMGKAQRVVRGLAINDLSGLVGYLSEVRGPYKEKLCTRLLGIVQSVSIDVPEAPVVTSGQLYAAASIYPDVANMDAIMSPADRVRTALFLATRCCMPRAADPCHWDQVVSEAPPWRWYDCDAEDSDGLDEQALEALCMINA